MKYRIPEHQRYPQWKSEQKNSLIDTVFRTIQRMVLLSRSILKIILFI